MFLRTETLASKKLIGQSITMSFSNNKTFELWRSFMPRKKEIKNIIGDELYSAEVYPRGFFENFDPSTTFDKWALVEVSDLNEIPEGMKTLTLDGLYAVFLHIGPASEGEKTYRYIFTEWLPGSAYALDDRPHFTVMGEKYKREDPDSEEEIWIPIQGKSKKE